MRSLCDCFSRAGRSVALNEAERANAQLIFEEKNLSHLSFDRC